MRVLITGRDGYLGWPLANYLASHGHEIAGIDNFYRSECIFVPQGSLLGITGFDASADPEAAACVLGVERLVQDGRIKPSDRVVIFNTGAATKYIEAFPLDLPVIEDPATVDFAALAR